MDVHDICSYEEWSARPEVQALVRLPRKPRATPAPVPAPAVVRLAAQQDDDDQQLNEDVGAGAGARAGAREPGGSVARLFSLCQQRGLARPLFEHDEVLTQRFRARLRIGRAIQLDGGGQMLYGSKKAASEALAGQGIEAVLAAPPDPMATAADGGGGVNWVSRLLEFYAKQHSANPTFEEFSRDLNSRHACECVIPHRPDHVFGGRDRFFASKKAARGQAARDAYEWLQAERVAGLDDGTPGVLSLRPTLSGSGALWMHERTIKLAKWASAAQKVNELCPLLQLPLPEYRLVPAGADNNSSSNDYASIDGHHTPPPALWAAPGLGLGPAPAPAGLTDCTAFFPRTAVVRTLIEPGGLFRDAVDTADADADPDPTAAFVKVGHVLARLGKKVAKEECARVVLASELVRRAAEKRGVEVVDGVLL
ncbi:MAG: hypothetical protein M1826_007769 [Phylliscum demangeonii]|nr:MAG: hypothetical protein M1826_007769 [Phylliscum demangeonii]